MRVQLLAGAIALALMSSAGIMGQNQAAADTPSPAGAKVYFINLKDGEHVKSPFLVQFGLTGMGIAPAGTQAPNTGHHHLIIDADTPTAGAPIPNDANHKHYGRGQTEDMITLPPGMHTLQLIFADAGHIPFVPPVESAKITITVDP